MICYVAFWAVSAGAGKGCLRVFLSKLYQCLYGYQRLFNGLIEESFEQREGFSDGWLARQDRDLSGQGTVVAFVANFSLPLVVHAFMLVAYLLVITVSLVTTRL